MEKAGGSMLIGWYYSEPTTGIFFDYTLCRVELISSGTQSWPLGLLKIHI